MSRARCPRCGAAFDCGAGGTEPCACERVELTSALLATLRERFTGCLCLRCLSDLSRAADDGGRTPPRPQPAPVAKR